MQQALRYWLVKGMQNALKTGFLKSRVLMLFSVVDIVSAKCFVVVPKRQIALDPESKHKKFMLKILSPKDIELYCKTKVPTESQIASMLDEWIYMAPQSSHVSNAYEIYRDCSFFGNKGNTFMQLTQFIEGSENIYDKIRNMKIQNLHAAVPIQMQQAALLFIIQIAGALEYAHYSNLTHGGINLSQIVSNMEMNDFKLINFRPWLASSRVFKQFGKDKETLSKATRLRLAKHMDLNQFGICIFEMLVGKVEEKAETYEIASTSINKRKYRDEKDIDFNAPDLDENTLRKLMGKAPLSMPKLEQIPAGWAQIPSTATIIEIIHICMVVETQRDTIESFRKIKHLAHEAFIRFYDSSLTCNPDVSLVSSEQIKKSRAASFNNRAVMTAPKIEEYALDKRISIDVNEELKMYQIGLLDRACELYPNCYEAQFNRLLLHWKRGQVFDEQVCDGIVTNVNDTYSAQLMLLTFRKTIGLSISAGDEKKVLMDKMRKLKTAEKIKPKTQIANRLKSKYLDFYKQQQSVGHNFFQHLVNMIDVEDPNVEQMSKFMRYSTMKQSQKETTPKDKPIPSMEVKKIYFSKNEKYLVMITGNQMVLLEVTDYSFEVKNQIYLPYNEVDESIITEHEDSMETDSEFNQSFHSSEFEKEKDEELKRKMTRVLTYKDGDENTSKKKELTQEEIEVIKRKQLADVKAHEEAIKQHSLGCGFFATQWIAAVDDDGKRIALHDRTTTQMHMIKGNQQELNSVVHVYYGTNFTQIKQIQVGTLINDEITEMFFDEDQIQQEDADGNLISQNTELAKYEREKAKVIGKTMKDLDESIVNEQNRLSRGQKENKKPKDETISRNSTQKHRVTPHSKVNMDLRKQQTAQPFDRKAYENAKKYKRPQYAQQITLNCKDLKSYLIDMSKEIYKTEAESDDESTGNHNSTDQLQSKQQIFLAEPPKKLNGNALPMSIFRETEEKEVTAFPPKISKRDAWGGYTTQHLDHIKEYIQKQELAGNLVKLPRYNNRYIIVYQKKRTQEYRPHFFLYEIMSRSVTRRFQAENADFDLFWDPNRREANVYSDRRLTAKHIASDDDDSDVQNINCFEVSPHGTFLVCIINEEIFSLKYLQEGYVSALVDSIEPFYYAEYDEAKIDKDAFGRSKSQFYRPTDFTLSNASSAGSPMRTPLAESTESDDIEDKQLLNAYMHDLWQQHAHKQGIPMYKLNKSLGYELAMLYQHTIGYTGQEQERHELLYLYYKSLKKALNKPNGLFQSPNPEEDMFDIQTSPRTLGQSFNAIKFFNSKYSKKIGYSLLQSESNNFSQKTDLKSIQKLQAFNSIVFGRSQDTIKFFAMSTLADKNYLAVFFRRALHVYDISSNEQIYEVFLPSCKSIQFINNDTMIVAQDGDCMIAVLSIESQRKSFQNKGLGVGTTDNVQLYRTNNQTNQYEMGIMKTRLNRKKDKYSLEDDSEKEDERVEVSCAKAIQFIRCDEKIERIVCARNTANYSGYIAVITESKIGIYLALDEGIKVAFDLFYSFDFYKLKSLGLGTCILNIDFTQSCEEFVGVMNNWTYAIFSIKNPENVRSLGKLEKGVETPVDKIETVGNPMNKIILYSESNQTLSIYNRKVKSSFTAVLNNFKEILDEGEKKSHHKINLSDGQYGFGHLTNFKVDSSDQFIICTFKANKCSTNSKIGIFSLEEGQLLRSITQPSTVNFTHVFIDDYATFMGYLDNSLRFVNIMVFEWEYKFNKPPKRKVPQVQKQQTIKKKETLRPISPIKDEAPQEKPKSPKKEKEKNKDKENKKKSTVCTIF